MCLLINVCLTFLFIIYTLLLYVEVAISQTVSLPANQAEEALFLGVKPNIEHPTQSNVHTRNSGDTAWFGPRLGRKKRSLVIDDEVIEALHKNNVADDMMTVTQFLRNYPWLVASTLADGKSSEYLSKRQNMKPRLGRSNTWLDDDDKMIKAPPFSPRLGRRSLIPLKPRLGRAGNNPETAVFKPRLGRDPNFNEFSDYIVDGRNIIDA